MVTRAAVFKWLPHDLQNVALELGQLVKEKEAIVRQTDFSRSRYGAATDQAGVGDGVVRGAEGSRAQQAQSWLEHTSHTVDLGGLNSFVESQWWQDGGNALGQHCLTGARWPDHQKVVDGLSPPPGHCLSLCALHGHPHVRGGPL